MTDTVIGRLVVELAGDAASLMKTYEEAQKQSNTLEANLKTIEQNLSSTGKNLTLKVTAPLLAAGGIALYTAKQFDDSMRQVQAVTKATGDQFEKLTKQAIDLGASTAWSASQVADAQKYLAMAGLDVNQVLEATPQMLSLASAGFLDLGSAADISTNILAGFNLEVSDLNHVADILAVSSSNANTSVSQMGEAMSYVGPIAEAANQSIEETAATIMVLSNAGIQGSMAGTSLRGALSALLTPTTEVESILAKYGITLEQVNPETHAFSEVIGTLSAAGLSAGDTLAIFGDRAGPGMSALMSAGEDAISSYTDILQNCDGAAQEMAETMEGGIGGASRELEGQMETLSIVFGNLIADAILPAAESVGDLANWLSNLDEGTQRTIVTTGIFVAAIGPATWALGSMAGGVSSMISLYRTYQATTFAATVATRGFTAAIAANPIGLAIIGTVSLTAVLIPLIASTRDAAEAQNEYNETLGVTADLTDKTDEQLQEEIDTLAEKSEKIREQIEIIRNQHTPSIIANTHAVTRAKEETAFDALAQGNLTRQLKSTVSAMNDGTYAVKSLDSAQQDATISALEMEQAEYDSARQVRELEQLTRALADGAKTAYDKASRAVTAHQDAVNDLKSEYDDLKATIDAALSIDTEITTSNRDVERADIRLAQAKADLEELNAEIKEQEAAVKSAESSEEKAAAQKELDALRLRQRSSILDVADAEDALTEAQQEQQAKLEEKTAIEEDLNGESISSAQARLEEIGQLLEDETEALNEALAEREDAQIAHENLMNQIETEALDTKSENWKKYVEYVNANPAIARTYNVVYDEEGKASYEVNVPEVSINLPEYKLINLQTESETEEKSKVSQNQSSGSQGGVYIENLTVESPKSDAETMAYTMKKTLRDLGSKV